MQITMATAEECVMDILNARLVPALLSSPGVGKSSLARSIADKHNMKVIDIRLSQLDPSDLNGFPFLQPAVNGVTKAGYVPMDIFPVETDPLPIKYTLHFNPKTATYEQIPAGHYSGWLVLLDEFNSAPIAVQAAAYKLVLDRMVGMFRMHPKCHVMTAGNLSTDKAIVNRVGTAMQSRLVWLELVVCVKAFMLWANTHDIDHRVKAFLNFKPDALHKFDPNHNEHTFPCPRTWEFISKLIKAYPDELAISKLPVLAGAVGEGMGREFYAFSKIYKQIPTIQEIISRPEQVSLTKEPSLQHAMAGLVAHHMNIQNADALMMFVRRLEVDFQGIVLRTAIARDVRVMETLEIKKWIKVHAKELTRY